MVHEDGGDIEYHGFDEEQGIVYLKMKVMHMLAHGSYNGLCRAPVRLAPAQRQRLNTGLKTCCSITLKR